MAFDDILLRIIADGLVVPIALVAGVTMLRLAATERYQAIARGVVTGLIALFFAGIARLFYQDGERPFQLLGVDPGAAYLENPGFPSDHTLLVFAIVIVVWATTKNKPLSLTLLVLAILVAAGRIMALVHTPADIAGGIACALAAGLLMYGRRLFTLDTTK